MKFCAHCGEQLSDEAVVCTKCGCAVNANAADKLSQAKPNKGALFGRIDWIPLCLGAISAFGLLIRFFALLSYYYFVDSMTFAILAIISAIPQLKKENKLAFYGLILGCVCVLAQIIITIITSRIY